MINRFNALGRIRIPLGSWWWIERQKLGVKVPRRSRRRSAHIIETPDLNDEVPEKI